MFSYTDDDGDSLSTDDDYSDLETPISTRNYFSAISNLAEIRSTLATDDSGLY